MGFKIDLLKNIVKSIEIVKTRQQTVRIQLRSQSEDSFDSMVNGNKSIGDITILRNSTGIDNTSNMSIDDIEYALTFIIRNHIRSLPGFDNRTANATAKLSNRGLTVQIIRSNRFENHDFEIRSGWGFGLGDKFKMNRLGLTDKTIDQLESIYK